MLTLTRGDESLKRFGAAVGFVIVALTLINQTVLQKEDFWLADYSVAINVFDLVAVSYFCLISPFGRNKIVKWIERARQERL